MNIKRAQTGPSFFILGRLCQKVAPGEQEGHQEGSQKSQIALNQLPGHELSNFLWIGTSPFGSNGGEQR